MKTPPAPLRARWVRAPPMGGGRKSSQNGIAAFARRLLGELAELLLCIAVCLWVWGDFRPNSNHGFFLCLGMATVGEVFARLVEAAFPLCREWWPPDAPSPSSTWRASQRHRRPPPRDCRRLVARAVWGPGPKQARRLSRRARLRKALRRMCAFEARFIARRRFCWTRKQREQLRQGRIHRVHLASRALLRLRSSGSGFPPPLDVHPDVPPQRPDPDAHGSTTTTATRAHAFDEACCSCRPAHTVCVRDLPGSLHGLAPSWRSASLVTFGFGLFGALSALCIDAFAGDAGNFDRGPFASNVTEGYMCTPLDVCARPFGADAFRLALYAAVRVGEASHPGPGGLRTTYRKRRNRGPITRGEVKTMVKDLMREFWEQWRDGPWSHPPPPPQSASSTEWDELEASSEGPEAHWQDSRWREAEVDDGDSWRSTSRSASWYDAGPRAPADDPWSSSSM